MEILHRLVTKIVIFTSVSRIGLSAGAVATWWGWGQFLWLGTGNGDKSCWGGVELSTCSCLLRGLFIVDCCCFLLW